MEHKYRVSFSIGGSSFEIESTDLEWLKAKEREYLNMLTDTSGIQKKSVDQSIVRETVVLPQNLTINEYYKRYIRPNKITSRPNIAVFFVYYLEKILKKETIKTQDVTQCFADVSYPNYNRLNVADILYQGKRKALLNNVNNLWSLTITGEDFVLNTITSGNQ